MPYEPVPPGEFRDYRYVVFIDEAGDDGLAKVRPIDPDGASEWFVLSAVVVSVKNEPDVPQWHKALREDIGHRQSRIIHFKRINEEWRREALCAALAQLPIRCFVVVSNKLSMRGHTNKRAAKVPARNPFYCWITRLLLERVTQWCGNRNNIEGTRGGKVKFVFSERGGMSYSQFAAYLHWLRLQSAGDSLYLRQGDLDWSVVSTDLIEAYNHERKAGLQLADVVASAFYQAVSLRPDGTTRPQYAELLRPRMALRDGTHAGFGVKMMPTDIWKYGVADVQTRIFLDYGYPERLLKR